MKKLKFKNEVKQIIRSRDYVESISYHAGVSIPTVRNWIDTDNLKLYSYPIVRHIAIMLNCQIDNLFEK